MALSGGGKEKEKERESPISKCMASLQVVDRTICTEIC
jgi:hypothetical protein